MTDTDAEIAPFENLFWSNGLICIYLIKLLDHCATNVLMYYFQDILFPKLEMQLVGYQEDKNRYPMK